MHFANNHQIRLSLFPIHSSGWDHMFVYLSSSTSSLTKKHLSRPQVKELGLPANIVALAHRLDHLQEGILFFKTGSQPCMPLLQLKPEYRRRSRKSKGSFWSWCCQCPRCLQIHTVIYFSWSESYRFPFQTMLSTSFPESQLQGHQEPSSPSTAIQPSSCRCPTKYLDKLNSSGLFG